MRLVFRQQAELELIEAQIWYEECAPSLGLEFARAVESCTHASATHARCLPAHRGRLSPCDDAKISLLADLRD